MRIVIPSIDVDFVTDTLDDFKLVAWAGSVEGQVNVEGEEEAEDNTYFDGVEFDSETHQVVVTVTVEELDNDNS